MTLKKWTLVAAALSVGLGIGAARHLAHAETLLDCSSLQKWSSSHTYKKGDVVWHDPGSSFGYKYQCIQNECPANWLPDGTSHGQQMWKTVGPCFKRP
jgi:hypothetical protein